MDELTPSFKYVNSKLTELTTYKQMSPTLALSQTKQADNRPVNNRRENATYPAVSSVDRDET